MTETELAEIEARAKAATEGPWERDGSYHGGYLVYQPGGPVVCLESGADGCTWRDLDFIAHARTDVPRLVEEVRKLRSALTKVEWGSCDGCGLHHYCPECGAPYGESYDPDSDDYVVRGHRPDCAVWEALK